MGGAAKRIGVVMGVVLGLTVAGSALAGVIFGTSQGRAVSTGLYVVGSFLIVLGVFSGIRGPLRSDPDSERDTPFAGLLGLSIFGSRVRTATGDERTDAVSTAALFIVIGFVLEIIGVAVDSRTGFL